MNGGYIDNVRITNSSFVGYEAIGGLVGQVVGGDNFFNRCSLVNPIEFFEAVTGTFEDGVQYYRYVYQQNDDTYNYVKIDLTSESSTYHVGDAIPTGSKDTDKIYILPHKYTISSVNKYQAGLVGNAQIADNSTYLNATFTNCYVTATIGDGTDTGGNTGGILGRCKNDSDKYTINMSYNFFEGIIISQGLYGAGILGDLDNGMGYINVDHNVAFVTYVYKGQYLNPDFNFSRAIATGNIELINGVQKYAHKNLNPIIGRATSSDNKLYNSYRNIGNWGEYYSKVVGSLSTVFGMQSYDEEIGEATGYYLTKEIYGEYIGFDLVNIWEYDQNTQRIKLR